jgi:hypothetical protein
MLFSQGVLLRVRHAQFGVVADQVSHPALWQLRRGGHLLVLSPYVIGVVFAVGAGVIALVGEPRLMTVTALAALIAGWSSAWSP